MNNSVSGAGGYAGIIFRWKDGKVDRVEVEGKTDKENEAFTKRVMSENEISQQMNKVSQKFTSNAEIRNGKLIGLRPMPVSCYGSSTDTFPYNLRTEIQKEMKKVFSGEADMQAVEEKFRDATKQMSEHLFNMGFGTGSDEDMRQVIADTYNAFRYDILIAAESACRGKANEIYDMEGVTGCWKYYDSSFYYMTEDVKSELLNVVEGISKEQGVEAPELSYKSPMPDFYNNFNSMFRGNMSHAGIIDTEVPPPKNFTFFIDMRDEGFVEVKIGDYTNRFSNSTGSNYNIMSDIVKISDKDFDNAEEINRFLKNLCFYDTIGMLYLSQNNLWKRSSGSGLNTKA